MKVLKILIPGDTASGVVVVPGSGIWVVAQCGLMPLVEDCLI